MLRRAAQPDVKPLAALRCEAYDESPTEAEAWLREIAGLENLLVLAPDPDANAPPNAMLAMVPVTCGARQGLWCADLLTRPALRGQGLMGRLLKAALRAWAADGAEFIVAAPPGKQARGYLMRFGFENAFPLRVLQRAVPQNLLAQAQFDALTVHQLQAARLQFQPHGIQLPEATMTGILRRLYSQGATVVSCERGYGIYYTTPDALHFIELQAESDLGADTLLQAARNKTGITNAQLLLGESQSLYDGLGRRCHYGMIRFLQQPFPVNDIYFRTLL